jgi:hypothetical protein
MLEIAGLFYGASRLCNNPSFRESSNSMISDPDVRDWARAHPDQAKGAYAAGIRRFYDDSRNDVEASCRTLAASMPR